ncbi:MAG: sodium:solute symporter family transporter, partial [Bythopirellula sp.]
KEGDRVLAHFVVNHLPTGLVGLTLAAVLAAAMSTLSSSLNSSATALINDIYLPLSKRDLDHDQQLSLSRWASAGFGIVQIAIALISNQIGANTSTVSSVLKIAGFALGPMLGLYFLAVFAPRVKQPAALLGFGVGVAVLSWVALQTALYWPWYAAVGATSTFVAGLMLTRFIPNSADHQESTPS